jgi:hypothetical protein
MRRLTHTALTVCFGLLAVSPLVMGQTPQVNTYVGLGTVTDSSNGQALDLFGTGTPLNTPRLTGLFATVGGGVMLTPHWGAGAEINWRAGQGDYAGVNYRPIFYDFNGIWQPLKTKRFVPEIQGGIGGVAVHFNANTQNCADPLVGCQSINLGSESSNHFQAHFAVAARIYATSHIFFRPAVDVHWVNDFFQFGSNWVPEYTMGVGYSFGGEK